jgi:hypothetical protein
VSNAMNQMIDQLVVPTVWTGTNQQTNRTAARKENDCGHFCLREVSTVSLRSFLLSVVRVIRI